MMKKMSENNGEQKSEKYIQSEREKQLSKIIAFELWRRSEKAKILARRTRGLSSSSYRAQEYPQVELPSKQVEKEKKRAWLFSWMLLWTFSNLYLFPASTKR